MTTMDDGPLSRMIHALEVGDRAALERVFAEDVCLRASLPRCDVDRSGRAEVAGLMLGWFVDSTGIARIRHTVDTVGDVWHAGYRFTLREAGADLVVEQHAYCIVADGLITSIRVMCSGFRPVSGAASGDGADAWSSRPWPAAHGH